MEKKIKQYRKRIEPPQPPPSSLFLIYPRLLTQIPIFCSCRYHVICFAQFLNRVDHITSNSDFVAEKKMTLFLLFTSRLTWSLRLTALRASCRGLSKEKDDLQPKCHISTIHIYKSHCFFVLDL